MIPPLKPGVTLAFADGPVIETERLILRRWRGDDVARDLADIATTGVAHRLLVFVA